MQELYMAFLAERVQPDTETLSSELHHLKDCKENCCKGAVGLSRDDDKRPDGATLIPWVRGKAVTWNVTVVDTFAQSYIGDTSNLTGAAANHAATLKTSKYVNITDTNIFVPIVIETGGAWDQQSIEFIQELEKRISVVTKELKETIPISTVIHGHRTR